MFYASDGTNVFTNTTMTDKEQFAKYPAYLIFGDYQSEIYPKEMEENEYLYRITDQYREIGSGKYVWFTLLLRKSF